ncbi:hypothetical protein [Arcanobacterium urinimassiliense]|uniref:hypothetical protein n=1 Tax=Arcanobacterium urinimassiliense TaxID=1871014 RepID=UPI00093B97F5|nr:hypothetical protein [Arcanobacterium urinimassiliense]
MGRKAYIIHPIEKEALGILYSRFIETGMTHEELANKLTTLGKTSAFNSLKGNRGTTITEFEELCTALGVSAVKVLKQAESAKTSPSSETSSSPSSPTTLSEAEAYKIAEELDRKLRAGMTPEQLGLAAKTREIDPLDARGEESQIPPGWDE